MSESYTIPERLRKIFESTDDFHIGPKIGKGAFSVVHIGVHKISNRKVAIKKIGLDKLSSKDYPNLTREILIQRRLNHPNIAKLYDYFLEDNNLYLILEYIPNSNLFRYLHKNKNLDFSEIQKIFRNVVNGVNYLHSLDFIHRDIKPENILIGENHENIKLCDFGWASHVKDFEWLELNGGTYAYMAPESLRREVQGVETDIWALGILLYEMFFVEEPFKGRSTDQQLKLILNMNLKFSKRNIPQSAIDLITRILKIDKNDRPSLDYILKSKFLEENFLKISPMENLRSNSKQSIIKKSALDTSFDDKLVINNTSRLEKMERVFKEGSQNKIYPSKKNFSLYRKNFTNSFVDIVENGDRGDSYVKSQRLISLNSDLNKSKIDEVYKSRIPEALIIKNKPSITGFNPTNQNEIDIYKQKKFSIIKERTHENSLKEFSDSKQSKINSYQTIEIQEDSKKSKDNNPKKYYINEKNKIAPAKKSDDKINSLELKDKNEDKNVYSSKLEIRQLKNENVRDEENGERHTSNRESEKKSSQNKSTKITSRKVLVDKIDKMYQKLKYKKMEGTKIIKLKNNTDENNKVNIPDSKKQIKNEQNEVIKDSEVYLNSKKQINFEINNSNSTKYLKMEENKKKAELDERKKLFLKSNEINQLKKTNIIRSQSQIKKYPKLSKHKKPQDQFKSFQEFLKKKREFTENQSMESSESKNVFKNKNSDKEFKMEKNLENPIYNIKNLNVNANHDNPYLDLQNKNQNFQPKVRFVNYVQKSSEQQNENKNNEENKFNSHLEHIDNKQTKIEEENKKNHQIENDYNKDSIYSYKNLNEQNSQQLPKNNFNNNNSLSFINKERNSDDNQNIYSQKLLIQNNYQIEKERSLSKNRLVIRNSTGMSQLNNINKTYIYKIDSNKEKKLLSYHENNLINEKIISNHNSNNIDMQDDFKKEKKTQLNYNEKGDNKNIKISTIHLNNNSNFTNDFQPQTPSYIPNYKEEKNSNKNSQMNIIVKNFKNEKINFQNQSQILLNQEKPSNYRISFQEPKNTFELPKKKIENPFHNNLPKLSYQPSKEKHLGNEWINYYQKVQNINPLQDSHNNIENNFNNVKRTVFKIENNYGHNNLPNRNSFNLK